MWVKKYHIYWVALALITGTACNKGYQITESGSNSASSTLFPNPTGSPTPTGGVCPPTNVNIPVKIMFVVDTSGSNGQWTQDNGTIPCGANHIGCAPPTDPKPIQNSINPKPNFRSGSIGDFFSKYEGKLNFSWGFITFSNNSATSAISSFGSPVFSDKAAMDSALAWFNSDQESDAGDTPYLKALSAVQTAIENDSGLHNSGLAAPLYYVIFLSDGFPSDAIKPDFSVDTAKLNSAIKSITDLAPDRITISTAYYGTINDADAAATLAGMTRNGGVTVNVDTSSTSTIDIQDLIQFPAASCN